MSSSGAIEGDGASNGDVPLEPTGPPLLELRKLSKHFGAVQALTEIDLKVYAGKVTALVGDNGAGKSVTLKTIAGIHPPDGGQIYWKGQPVHIRAPRDSAALGIETVYQDLALCNNLDIVQNMFLGRERTRGVFLDENPMETAASQTLASLACYHCAFSAPGRGFFVGWAASGGRCGQGRHVELRACDHGRADGRLGGGPNRHGPRTDPAFGGTRSRGHFRVP